MVALGTRREDLEAETHAAQQRLAADNRQLGVPEFGSILASGLCDVALTVSAVCCS